MRLRILVPTGVEVDTEADAVTADGLHGSFTVLEHHVDALAVLVPGILLVRRDGNEDALAIDDGVLVKNGDELSVATLRVVAGRLGELERVVREDLLARSEHEQRARKVLDRMQADFVRRLTETEVGR